MFPKIQCCSLVLALLGSFFMLSGCKGTEKPVPLSIDIPDVIEWEENSGFSYSVVASGEAPLRFVLSQTADSALFSIDKNTGVIVSKQAFDFENPVDANADGSYELSVIVLDDKDQGKRADFLVKITNNTESGILVDFPAPDSNVGGAATHFTIRGRVLEEGLNIGSLSSNLKVLVNGVAAEFSDALVGTWVLDTSLIQGNNIFDIELLDADKVIATTQLTIQNSFVPAVSSLVSDGSSIGYAIDLSGKAVVKLDLNGGEVAPLLLIEQMTADLSCEGFNSLDLLDQTKQMVLTCFNSANNASVLAMFNREDETLKILTERASINYGTRFNIVNNDYLVYRSGSVSFQLINLKTQDVIDLNVVDELGENDFAPGYFVAGNNLYLHPEGSWPQIAVVDLEAAIDAGNSTVVANTIDLQVTSDSAFLGEDGQLYIVNGSYIDVVDLTTGLIESRAIIYSESGHNTLAEAYRIDVEYVGNNTLVLRAQGAADLYTLDLTTNTLSSMKTMKPALFGAWQTSMSPDHSEFVLFDADQHILSKVDLAGYKLEKQFDLSGNTWDGSYAYGQFNYDFASNILYQHRVVSWGGVRVGDDLAFEPMLVAYNVDSGSASILLNAMDLATFFGDQNASYRLGEAVVTDDPNILWFSMLVFLDDGAEEGVYSYNLTTGAISPVWQYLNDSSVNPDDPYLSSFSSFLNGVILTEWNDGYVSILDKTGKVTKLRESFSPYVMTHDSDVDATRNLLYFDGYLGVESGVAPDYNSFEVVEYNLLDGSQRVIASHNLGQGLDFRGMNFHLDENRKNLVSVYQGYLIILDTFSGDRVLKAL